MYSFDEVLRLFLNKICLYLLVKGVLCFDFEVSSFQIGDVLFCNFFKCDPIHSVCILYYSLYICLLLVPAQKYLFSQSSFINQSLCLPSDVVCQA